MILAKERQELVQKFYDHFLLNILKLPFKESNKAGNDSDDNSFPGLPHYKIFLYMKPFYLPEHNARGSVHPDERVMEKIEQSLLAQRHFGKEELNEIVRFCIIGGSLEMQILVQNLGVLFDSKSEIISTSKFLVYVVPFSINPLSKFISSRDIWYRRNVYAAFVKPRFLPGVGIPSNRYEDILEGKEVTMDSISKFNLPDVCLDNALQNYIHFANKVYELGLLKAECHTDKEQAEFRTPSATLYFCESLQIWQSTSVKIAENNREIGMSIKEMVKNEGQPKPLDLILTYRVVDQVFQSSKEAVKVHKKIVRLGVYNLPSINSLDPGRKASPDHNPLLSYLDLDGFKSREKLVNSINFSKNKDETKLSIIDSLYFTDYIDEIEISSQKSFQIKIDGRVFGNYTSVKVTKLAFKNGVNLKIPIATFFDIQEH